MYVYMRTNKQLTIMQTVFFYTFLIQTPCHPSIYTLYIYLHKVECTHAALQIRIHCLHLHCIYIVIRMNKLLSCLQWLHVNSSSSSESFLSGVKTQTKLSVRSWKTLELYKHVKPCMEKQQNCTCRNLS